MEKEVVLFSSLLPPPTGTQLDELFLKRGWQLQRWVSEGGTPGYQIYFGPGVQVDNHYEYGFPYLYEEAELLSFAHGFYIRQMANSVERSTTVVNKPVVRDCVLGKSQL